jgi:predicted GNAT family acetyltransferase
LDVEGHVAELVYRVEGTYLVLNHTEVPEALEGRGLGGVLVRAALDRAVRDGPTIVPLCPFARGWLGRHPDEAGRAPMDWKAGAVEPVLYLVRRHPGPMRCGGRPA